MLSLREGTNHSIVSECHEPRIPEGFSVLPLSKIIEKILGKKYFVSIAFVRQKKMQAINKAHRNKNAPTDVLSFPLDKTQGEILFSLRDVRLKARTYKLEARDYLPYLLIHALLHLKGFDHGSKMEEQEKKFCNTFKIKNPYFSKPNERQNNSRNRHRDVSGTRRRSDARNFIA